MIGEAAAFRMQLFITEFEEEVKEKTTKAHKEDWDQGNPHPKKQGGSICFPGPDHH